ncbi:MAG TPA: alcohol dehydrogenase catalytic domain-containing protein [Thermoanaerobaculia bacterium]|nr:alcohol dehydrogenase catalytic domain-containing protein [Thermoanaerobaculia bacterium]
MASLVERPDPVPGPGEIVVAVKAALTCGTDLKLLRRGHPKVPFPVTLGHEMAGVVEAAGAEVPFAPGDRVTSAVTAPCGACAPCRDGRGNLCETAFEAPLWGAYADLVLLSPRLVRGAVRRIPVGLSFEAAALLDPLASVVHGLMRVPAVAGGSVLIAGSGPIAALHVALLRRGAGRIVVAAPEPARLRILEGMGAETVLLEPGGSVASAVAGSFELVVDTTGSPAVASSLAARAAPGGTLLLFAGMAAGSRLDVDAFRVHYEEVNLVGTFHYRPPDADRALSFLATGAVDPAPVLSGTRPLAEWRQAFDDVERGEAMKTVLVP